MKVKDGLSKALVRPVAFYPVLAGLCGSIAAGVILSQAVYWSERTTLPGEWFYKAAREWQQETGLTRHQQESARRLLREQPFWQEKLQGVPATLHFRLDREGLFLAISQFSEGRKTRISESGALDADYITNKYPNQMQASPPQYSNALKEAQTTTGSAHETPKTKEAEIELPPTPLLEESDEAESGERAGGLIAAFKLRLKDEMQNASFQSSNLAFDDYDRYFRDAHFSLHNGVMLVDSPTPDQCAEGLRKYQRRLKDTFEREARVEVEFRMAE